MTDPEAATSSAAAERRSRPRRERTPIYDQLAADRERRAQEQQEAES
ncbi:hypothetical protein [Microbacterium sp.]|nr:hypothetical protein [Microbacterium oxydans]